jgi:predicted Ser/Thr protein kinase
LADGVYVVVATKDDETEYWAVATPCHTPLDAVRNQDISSLVGKVDIRKLETFAQNDPDAYSYSGGLNRANQGILEFVEMFCFSALAFCLG